MIIPPSRQKRRARIEIIPLIDIMFFLLATFVMVSLSMVKNLGVDVHLPVAASGAPLDRKDYATITVRENGDLYWNKNPVAFDQVTSRLKELKATSSEPKIFLNGDANARFQDIISVLDEARKLGIAKVAIETARKQ